MIEEYNWLLFISGHLGRIGSGNFREMNMVNADTISWNANQLEMHSFTWKTNGVLTFSSNVQLLSALMLLLLLDKGHPWNPKIPKHMQFATGVMASSIEMRTASTREEILDRSSCSSGVFCWAWPLVTRCNPVDNWLQWCWIGIEPCIIPKCLVHGKTDSCCQGQWPMECSLPLLLSHIICVKAIECQVAGSPSVLVIKECAISLSTIPLFLESNESTSIVRSRWECSCKNLNNFVVLRAISTGLAPIDSAWKCAFGTINFVLVRVCKNS